MQHAIGRLSAKDANGGRANRIGGGQEVRPAHRGVISIKSKALLRPPGGRALPLGPIQAQALTLVHQKKGGQLADEAAAIRRYIKAVRRGVVQDFLIGHHAYASIKFNYDYFRL